MPGCCNSGRVSDSRDPAIEDLMTLLGRNMVDGEPVSDLFRHAANSLLDVVERDSEQLTVALRIILQAKDASERAIILDRQ